jgi:electron transfer flavoprotein alpha subunit
MAAMNRIVVLAEQREGRPLTVALELVAAARRFAGDVDAVTWGAGAAEVAGELGAHGVRRCFSLGDLDGALAGPRAAAAVAGGLGAGELADAVLAATTYDGRDVLARLSVRLDRPVLTNVVGLDDAGGALVSSHAVFGGSRVVRARFTGAGPALFLVRPKSFAPEPTGGGAAELVELDAPSAGPTDAAEVVARHVGERSGPSLDDASVVVSGGRGLGSPEHYALVEELARLLGGAPAASRAIVDAGWVPYAYQVGQTGKTVKPDVYLAFGISGATQHLVGMRGALHVVAVNKDPSAPILGLADLGLVGDVHQVLPKLVEAIRARL